MVKDKKFISYKDDNEELEEDDEEEDIESEKRETVKIINNKTEDVKEEIETKTQKEYNNNDRVVNKKW